MSSIAGAVSALCARRLRSPLDRMDLTDLIQLMIQCDQCPIAIAGIAAIAYGDMTEHGCIAGSPQATLTGLGHAPENAGRYSDVRSGLVRVAVQRCTGVNKWSTVHACVESRTVLAWDTDRLCSRSDMLTDATEEGC
jgi:hypothetical protein